MNAPENFVMGEDYSCYRPEGKVTLPQATALLSGALSFAKEHHVRRLLVDATRLEMPFPTLPDRYFSAREWAAAAGGAVRFVLVMSPEMIDPQKFGVLVARNAGLAANVFPTEPEAVEWLLSDRTD